MTWGATDNKGRQNIFFSNHMTSLESETASCSESILVEHYDQLKF